jgi:hypothetical protein
VIAPDRRLSIFSLKDPSDARGWTDRAVVSSFGVNVAVSTDDPALLTALCERLPPHVQSGPKRPVDLHYSIYSRPTASSPGRVQPMYVGHSIAGPFDAAEDRSFGSAQGNLFVETLDQARACEAFESTVQVDVAAASTEWIFIHAGVVVHDGGAIVIPAPPMRGTSTLVDALVRAGATYYSDEYAVIDRDGRIHPFCVPLSIRTGDGGKRRVSLGDRTMARPAVPIRTIVSTRHEVGAVWQARRGTPAESAVTLLSNAVRVRLAPRSTLDVLARAVESAVLLEGPRGEASLVAPQLLNESRQPPSAHTTA